MADWLADRLRPLAATVRRHTGEQSTVLVAVIISSFIGL